ncbi:MAG: hypothetical protein AW07_01394 [Candidatus Accumulibacter sp. SK-11]|nr:MAG: hypothetical protein AW07_01394 [Candidatus Accumulibacter sp. SK-11]
MNPRGAGLLGEAGDELFDGLAGDHHQVRQFVDDDDDVGQGAQWLGRVRRQRHRIGDLFTIPCGIADALVETGDVAHPHRRHQLVALVHLADAPVERVGSLLHVNHDWRQQVRDALVDRQFEHLRVDQNQPYLVGLRLVEQRQDHRVDAHRLARAGRSGDQQVRHFRQIDDQRLAADVLAERHRQRRVHVAVFLAGDDLQQADRLPLRVREFERHRRLAGYRLDHAHRDQGQRARQVLGQIEDLGALDAHRRFDFVARDDRPRVGSSHRDLDAEVGKLALDQSRGVFDGLRADAATLWRRRLEQVQRWQHAALDGFREQGRLPFAVDPLLDLRWQRAWGGCCRFAVGNGPDRLVARQGFDHRVAEEGLACRPVADGIAGGLAEDRFDCRVAVAAPGRPRRRASGARCRRLRRCWLMAVATLLLEFDDGFALARHLATDAAILPAPVEAIHRHHQPLEQGADAFGGGDPRHAGKDAPAEQEHGEERQGGTRVAEIANGESAEFDADDATGTGRQACLDGIEAQGLECAAGNDQDDETGQRDE